MTDQEVIEMMAAILIQREGGEIILDGNLMEFKEPPEFEIDRDGSQIYIRLKEES